VGRPQQRLILFFFAKWMLRFLSQRPHSQGKAFQHANLAKGANAILREIFGVFQYKCSLYREIGSQSQFLGKFFGRFQAGARHKKWRKVRF